MGFRNSMGAVALAVLAPWIVLGCSQDQQVVSVRSFERAQRMDVVCLKVFGEDPSQPGFLVPIPPEAVPEAQCAPTPPNAIGSTLPYHLYALVTQTAHGEIAVVDLTAGVVVDEDRSTPGINFLPVGAFPADVAVSPDGQTAFVTAAEPNKPAVYALPTNRLLGDSQGLPIEGALPVAHLASWPVCALPQTPGSVSIVPRSGTTSDAGGGSDTYEIAVVLPGDDNASAKLITLDPAPFLNGADGSSSIAPGSLSACPVTSVIELSSPPPSAAGDAVPWSDGIPYVDGGADLSKSLPAAAARCSNASALGVPDGGPGVDSDAGSPSPADGGGAPSTVAPTRPHATLAVRDGNTLYVGDDALPVIHAIDLSIAGSPRELPPLLATSAQEPSRRVKVGSLAVSPTTHDFKRYLYALDVSQGSIIVYDITDPPTAPRAPLTRPHPELNPFQPSDRLVFSAPVAAFSFVRHDFVLTKDQTGQLASAKSGVLCNPNPNAGNDQGGVVIDPGVFYRANSTNQEVAIGPTRLRGVLAFATLETGQVMAVDVDDWDAPCRRPDPMDATRQVSDIAVPQPTSASSADVDPYHAPLAFAPVGNNVSTPVTLESFFPVSAPHRLRSAYYLRRDPQTGIHVPNLVSPPQLFADDAPLATTGPRAAANPVLFPTASSLLDPNSIANPTEPNPDKRLPDATISPDRPNVRFAWEDPQVHVDQDWTVTFEGPLPGFDGVVATVASTDFQTLDLSVPKPLFCRGGIEDARLGAERARAASAVAAAAGVTLTDRLAQRTADYVQITDEVLPVDDPYWTINDSECFAADATAQQRQALCQSAYGNAGDESVQRDFPILEASADKLVVGRFGYAPGAQTTASREVVASDPSNVAILKQMRCCFHRQVRFRVRTGATWVAVGTNTGYLHHIATDPATNACVQSCASRDTLLNARTFEVVRGAAGGRPSIDRNSPLSMRNPMFSYVIATGAAPTAPDVTSTRRDYVWKFTTRGQFVPLIVNLAATTNAVSPQSMRFINALGQLAVVDGSSQGLVLIDLNTVATAHAPYY